MAEQFEPHEYPLQYIVLEYAKIHDEDIKKPQILAQLYNEIVTYLSYVLYEPTDIKYLDYDLKFNKFGDEITIKANNILTALWFVNVFPENTKDVHDSGKYRTHKGTYFLNKRTKKLILKNNNG